MKPFLFAVSLLALSAAGGTAEDVPTAPAPTPVGPSMTTGPAAMSGPVMMSGPSMTAGPVMEYAPAPMAQPARRGLFGRLRNRNAMTYSGTAMPTMMSAPTSAPMMMSAPTSAPTMMSTPTPMPPTAMPGTKSSSGAMMMPGMVVPAGGSMVVPAGGTVVPATGNLPPGVYTTTDGTVVQIGGTQMSTSMSSPMSSSMSAPAMTAQPTRGGLFGRLRNR